MGKYLSRLPRSRYSNWVSPASQMFTKKSMARRDLGNPVYENSPRHSFLCKPALLPVDRARMKRS